MRDSPTAAAMTGIPGRERKSKSRTYRGFERIVKTVGGALIKLQL